MANILRGGLIYSQSNILRVHSEKRLKNPDLMYA